MRFIGENEEDGLQQTTNMWDRAIRDYKIVNNSNPNQAPKEMFEESGDWHRIRNIELPVSNHPQSNSGPVPIFFTP